MICLLQQPGPVQQTLIKTNCIILHGLIFLLLMDKRSVMQDHRDGGGGGSQGLAVIWAVATEPGWL